MKRSRWPVILFALIATNVATGYIVKKNAPPKVDPQRDMRSALAKMSAIKGPFIVIIGDSLTQNARLPTTVCGLPLINAGIGGSRASSFIPFAEEMTAQQLSPSLVVIALGINDAMSTYRTAFRSTYALLIESLPKSPIVLATLAPIDIRLPVASRFNASTMKSINATIMEIAESRHAPVIDLGAISGLESSDGIHPTESTYRLWNRAIVSGIEIALKCN